jgi:transposase InsO family protein
MARKLSLLFIRLLSILIGFLAEAFRLGLGLIRPKTSLVAENLFLRKQLAFYGERNVTPRRLTDSARLALLLWSRWFDWTNALVVVKPETLVGWHRRASQLFWGWKSRGGRPRLPGNLRALIVEMVRQNPTWGEARIASELALKLGIRVSPRAVRAYWPEDPSPVRGPSSQRWTTFVRNHARAIVACDFVVAVTLRFRILYVFVVMEVGSRKILHVNVTPHPTSAWTLQQLRESIPSDHAYRWLIHDRSGIFSANLDRDMTSFGIAVLKTPVRAPKANAYCERLIGSLRRECLDWFIPLSERHVLTLAREWAVHYNEGRPHSRLGPGIPDPPPELPTIRQNHGYDVPEGFSIKKRSILGGLHHEYRLERIAA